MATKSLTNPSDRDRFIQELKNFIGSDEPLSVLLDNFMMEEAGRVCNLALDEETEKHMAEFCEHSENIEKILAVSQSRRLAEPIGRPIAVELAHMDDAMRCAVYQAADTMFNTLAGFFIAKRLVPFLKELAVTLEVRGGAA